MAEADANMLNSVYREISEQLGMDTAMEIYRMFKDTIDHECICGIM